MKNSRNYFLALCFFVCISSLPTSDAEAFSRGLASKVRSMQSNAYLERLSRAQQAYKSGNYTACVQEARQALQHASTSAEKAFPAHQLLAAAHTKLKDPAAASEHFKWLAEHRASK